MISCIVLSAGFSTRFGAPKALALLNKDTRVIEYIQRTLINSNVDEVIIVLGAYAESIKPCIFNHKKVTAVYNKDFNFGQTSSFKTGLNLVAPDALGIMLLPVDTPAVKTETINTLIDTYNAKKPEILIPTFNQKNGHPPIFNACLRKDLSQIDNAVGLNVFIKQQKSAPEFVEIKDEAIVRGFNTPEEFKKLRSSFF